MDNKYVITPNGNFVHTDELKHWGIRGMKWGIRRYQNPDGSLTEKGKKRYANPDGTLNEKGKKKFGNSVKKVMERKSAKDMTDEELDRAIVRARKEDEYNRLRPDPSANKKKSVLMEEVVKPAAVNAGRNLVSKMMNSAVEKLTGNKVDPDSYEYLKKYYDKLKVKKDINDLLKPKEKEKGLSWDDKLKKQQYDMNEEKRKREREAADAAAAAKAAKQNEKDDSSNQPSQPNKAERVINDYSKNTVSKTSAYDADYEKNVNALLAEMDNKGWEIYYRDYANRRDDD